MVEHRLAQAGRAVELRAVEHLARTDQCDSRCRWCARRPARRNFRARTRSGPSACGSPRRRRSCGALPGAARTERSLAAWPVRLSAFSGSAGTFGGGGGGGVPSSTSITYLPRCTGEVRMAVDVNVRMLRLAQQSETIRIGQRHAPEAAAHDVGNPVVLGQTLIDERVVGGQQVEDVAVFAHDAVEQQLRLAAHRVGEGAVEIRDIRTGPG